MTQAATQHGPWPAARRAIGLGIALSAATWLAACSILPAQTPVDTYVLPGTQWQRATPTGTTGNAANTGPALRIARPVAHGVLASKRIVVMPQADRQQVYQGAVWSDPAPHMLRHRLLDAFLADGRLPWVDTDESPGAQVDYLLTSQLRSFHSSYQNGSPVAVIRIDAQIVNTRSNRIIASRSFITEQAAASKAVPDVVQALGQASDLVAREMANWAAGTVAAAGAAR